jgi:long-chain acyl-CoA synthetase
MSSNKISKRRAVICVSNPQDYIDQLKDYSIMIVNPFSTAERIKYLLDRSDYSLLITDRGEEHRNGGYYENEKVLWYTSGTTGDSKFYTFNEEQIATLSKKICKSYDLTKNDRYVSLMGLWHSHGQGFYWATKFAGCEVNYLPVKNIRELTKYNPTFITATPDVVSVASHMKFSSLRFVRTASSALPVSLYKKIKEKLSVPVIEAFGMTETLSHCFTNPLYGEQRVGTVGLPDDIEVKIADGHLWLKGSVCYKDTWFDTGDLAEQDAAGYYRIVGRSVDRIEIRGFKFDPLSIENQLFNKLPNLKECAVFGEGSINCIYVGPYTEKEVSDTMYSFGKQLKPNRVLKVEEIEKNNVGKISRSSLKKYC